jgi:hypothetical protein
MPLTLETLEQSFAQQVAQAKAIDKAIAFSIEPVLNRYITTHNVPMKLALEHERELKRYLAMCAERKQGLGIYGLCGPVDDLWHTFIIFTNLYQDFCATVAGRFLHHTPTEAATGDAYINYARTLETYEQTYNEKPPSHIWPSLDEKMMGASGSTDCGS